MQIIPIASGKGGVGKSLLSANLAISLAQAGNTVVLADLDLGGSNLHLILGQTSLTKSLGTFLYDKEVSFDEVLLKTEYKNLFFIPGEAEIPGMANLKDSQKRRLINNLRDLDVDYLILDLGAGTSFNTMDFFLMSGRGVIVTSPTLTAVLNAYLFLKNAVFRIMNSSFKRKTPAWQYLEKLKKDGNTFQKVYIPKLIENIEKIDPESFKIYQEKMESFHPRVVLNMLEDPKDTQQMEKLRRSSREYLGLDLEHMGVIYRDDLQDTALRSRLPIIIYKPQSVLAQAVERISEKIISEKGTEDCPLDYESLETGYQMAFREAEADFSAKMSYVEDLLQCGALTQGDLVETVKTQQIEIRQLKKENQFLKAKLVKAGEAGVDF